MKKALLILSLINSLIAPVTLSANLVKMLDDTRISLVTTKEVIQKAKKQLLDTHTTIEKALSETEKAQNETYKTKEIITQARKVLSIFTPSGATILIAGPLLALAAVPAIAAPIIIVVGANLVDIVKLVNLLYTMLNDTLDTLSGIKIKLNPMTYILDPKYDEKKVYSNMNSIETSLTNGIKNIDDLKAGFLGIMAALK